MADKEEETRPGYWPNTLVKPPLDPRTTPTGLTPTAREELLGRTTSMLEDTLRHGITQRLTHLTQREGTRPMLDIVFGGQYGDEGKGQVAAHAAEEHEYYFSLRVGGYNAEHRFKNTDNRKFTARVIPSAAWVDPDVKLVLGAGHVLHLGRLEKEMEQLDQIWGEGHTANRLFLDPNAAIVPDENRGFDEETAHRGSTHQGVGKTVSQKVRRDGTFKVAKDYEQAKPYLADTVGLMDRWMVAGYEGLAEGSQGTLLSLDLGHYPYNTGKNVTAAAILGEAGVAPMWIDNIIACYRTVPMRVPGESGPTGGREMSWEELEGRADISIPEQKKTQTDSPEGNRERVFEWSWDDFKRSIAINRPDKMVLTFLDWYDGDPEDLIDKMESIASVGSHHAEVTLRRDGPDWSDHRGTVLGGV